MITLLTAALAGAALFVLAYWLPQRNGCNGASCGACGHACSQLLEADDEETR
jgi:uncharacterized ferredoxin-like protein